MTEKPVFELDKLFDEVGTYRDSADYKELLTFIKRFRTMAPYNAMLLHIQNPGAVFAASAADWKHRFGRQPQDRLSFFARSGQSLSYMNYQIPKGKNSHLHCLSLSMQQGPFIMESMSDLSIAYICPVSGITNKLTEPEWRGSWKRLTQAESMRRKRRRSGFPSHLESW